MNFILLVVLSRQGLLTLVQESHSSAPFVYAKFFLCIYIGEISGSNPDNNEITVKTLINCNRSFTEENVLFAWGDFVLNG